MKRRSFFSRISSLVAAVALAPEIAFRARLELPYVQALNLEEFFKANYRIKREREKALADYHITPADFEPFFLPGGILHRYTT